ncbi:MAG: GTP cyclohydrolase I [Nitrospirales bacterium]|nr:GTP cyclohydrolase I [Nitrospirales bacterium]
MNREQIYFVKNIRLHHRVNRKQPFWGGWCHVMLLVSNQNFPIPLIIQCGSTVSRAGQHQEHLTRLIANSLQSTLYPQGVGVLVEARYIAKPNQESRIALPKVLTMAPLGQFKPQQAYRQDFLQFVK